MKIEIDKEIGEPSDSNGYMMWNGDPKCGFKDFYDMKSIPKPKFLVDDLLQERSVLALAGTSGSGKSYLAVAIAGCIAAGIEWGEFNVEQGAVIYMIGEGADTFADRIEGFVAHNKVSLDNFPFYCDYNSMNFYDPDYVTAIISRIKQLEKAQGIKVRVFVIDTLAKCASGMEENSNSDVSKFIKQLDRIVMETGVAIILVHHTGKSDTRTMRGGSALKADVNTVAFIDKNKRGKTLRVDKQKSSPEIDPFWIKEHDVTLEDGNVVKVYMPDVTAPIKTAVEVRREFMIQTVRDNPGIILPTLKLTVAAADPSNRRANASDDLAKLISLGQIEEIDGGYFVKERK